MKKYFPLFCTVLLAAVAPLTPVSLRADDSAVKPSGPSQKVAPAPVVGVKELMKEHEKYSGKDVVLEGFVTDICKKKGCWAMIHDADSDSKSQLRVKQEDESSTFKAFLPEVQGKTVQVTGKVNALKIDKDYLDKWEARVKSPRKEGATEEEKDGDVSTAASLKQIAALREKVAKSKDGYLLSVSLAVSKWEVKPGQP